MKKCTQCGAELPDSAKFCGFCGGRLDEVKALSKTEPKSEPVASSDVGGIKDVDDDMPDAVRSRLEWWHKAFFVMQIGAGLAYAFLPNVYRWTHGLHQYMDEYGYAPSLWLFWLPLVLTWLNWDIIDKSALSSRKAVSEYFDSPRFILYRAGLCAVLAGWVCFDYFDRIHEIWAVPFYVYETTALMCTFLGPIVCGVGWTAALYCLNKMRRIAMDNP